MQIVEPIRVRNDIEKIKQILKLKRERNLILFILGINSGLRISDLLKLKISDVKNKNFVEVVEQKTGKKKRFPLTPPVQRVIQNYTKKRPNNQLLFKSQKGRKAISRVQAYRIIKKACNKAGITSNIGTHSLRKTFGYHFYQQTKDVALLQNILNHSTPAITLRYIGINQEMIDAKLNAFYL